MSKIERIEQQIRDANTSAFALQQDLTELLLESDGADTPEIVAMRAEVAKHQARVRDLSAALRIAYHADGELERRQNTEEARAALGRARKLERRYIAAAAAIEAAVEALRTAQSEFAQVHTELGIEARAVIDRSRLRESDRFGKLMFVYGDPVTGTAKKAVDDGTDEGLAALAQSHVRRVIALMESALEYAPSTSDPAPIHHDESSAAVLARGS